MVSLLFFLNFSSLTAWEQAALHLEGETLQRLELVGNPANTKLCAE